MRKKLTGSSGSVASHRVKKKSESIAHYESILLEAMRSEFKAVADGVMMLGERLNRFQDETRQEFVSVRGAIAMVHQDLVKKINSVEYSLDQKIDSVKSELKADIKDVSMKFDRIDNHLAHHDEEIRLLKQA